MRFSRPRASGLGASDSTERRWRWVGLAAVAGLAMALPALWRRQRRRLFTTQDDWIAAYVRGRTTR